MEYLGPGNEGVTPEAAAGILVERLKNAGDLGDRRDALDALLKLSQDHPTEVGNAGMPIFTDILQAGIADRSMTQTIMGIMLNLVSEEGTIVSSFLKDVRNVQNLLDLLESTDTLSALSSVQVLQALQKSSADALEACILECPAGLQALVQVLRDPREEVRNEVILLLGQLTSSNLEVKKFVAFQEGFERLFDIMSGEGMLEGGSVIVKDCLHVCLNLVTGSPLTKALFCQSGCLKRFHQLIDVRIAEGGEVAATTTTEGNPETEGAVPGDVAEGDEQAAPSHEGSPHTATGMSDVQNEIACKALDLLLLLLARDGVGGNATDKNGGGGGGVDDDSDSKRPERQTLVADVEEGMLSEMLAHVAFSRADAFSHAPAACRERAMRAVGALVDGHPTNQYNLGELLIQDVGLDSVSLATLVVEGALGKGGAEAGITDTFHWVLGRLLHGNELGCTQLVSHIIAPPPPPLELEDIEAWVPPTPPGKMLLDSLAASAKVLFDDGSGGGNDGASGKAATQAADVMSRGCMILSMLFTHGGALAKEISLRIPFSPAPGAHLTTLLHVLLRWLELATSHSSTAPAAPATIPAEMGAANSGKGVEPSNSADRTASIIGRATADAGISVMRLLCGWMYGCSAAAREVLENPANLFVVDVAAGRCPLLLPPPAGDEGSATAVQRVAVKGLACLMLGLLLEYVEDAAGTGAPRSGGGASEWTRALVMKMIQKRVGMTPFMASIEATKRAFSEAETAQRRRHRAARERKPSDGGCQQLATSGVLRLDPSFSSLLAQASEEVRRRVISILTHGDSIDNPSPAADTNGGGEATTTTSTSTPGSPGGSEQGGRESGTGSGMVTASGRGAGLAAMVELQEREIAGLREELSEALSRVPRGGGEGGGISALEDALRKQVTQLEAAALEQSKEFDSLRGELRDAVAEVDQEKESRRLLTSELEGLAVSVSSMERQLLDREAICDGLRRQLDAGGDLSAREKELSKQLEEAHRRALSAEEALEVSQRQSLEEAAAADKAEQEESLEAAAKWEAKVEDLQVALEEARKGAASALAAQELAAADSSREASAAVSAQLADTQGELEAARRSLVESEARVEQVEQALAAKTDEAEANSRETELLLRKAAEEAEASVGQERQAAAAVEARRAREANTAAVEMQILRQQLDNAVRSLAEASSGGDEQIEALQKQLTAAKEREEHELVQSRRRVEEVIHQAKEDQSSSELALRQAEQKLNDQWTLQMQDKEALIVRLQEEIAGLKEAQQVVEQNHALQIAQVQDEHEELQAQAEQVEVLMARCARLEEAAVSAGADTERRLREEMEREKGLARGAEGTVSALSKQLEEAAKEVSEKANTVAELTTRLDEVQAFLSQSEEERLAAEEREAKAMSETKAIQQAVRDAEDRLRQVEAEVEDRDAVIAAVEDARAKQEREAERLRDKLSGFGKTLSPLASRTNGPAGNTANGGGATKDFSGADEGGREDLVDSAEYLELVSEHEDLLQLLAQQDVVRKKLLRALQDKAGEASVRAVMEDAEAEVTHTYGMFVHTDDLDIDDHRPGQEEASLREENSQPSGASRTVAV
ncbi:unnamed protein product [Scytosiphon promiscuus]